MWPGVAALGRVATVRLWQGMFRVNVGKRCYDAVGFRSARFKTHVRRSLSSANLKRCGHDNPVICVNVAPFCSGALCPCDLHNPIFVSSSSDNNNDDDDDDDDDALPEALTLQTAAPTVQHTHTASVFAPYYVIIIYDLGYINYSFMPFILQ